MRVQVLGGGRMGAALLRGFLDGGLAPSEVVVVERDPDRRAVLTSGFPGVRIEPEPVAARDVLVCTKPADVHEALRRAVAAGLQRVVSIAAGVGTASIEAVVGEVPVVRAMPNTPALLGAGVTAIAAGRHAREIDLEDAEASLRPVGTVVRVEESELDAVTAVSGSGPAYVFLLAEHLRSAAVRVGLSDELADTLVRQTVLGAARMLVETGDDPADLRAAVTSPGGTTAAAVAAFEDGGFGPLVERAVVAAAERAAELGAAAAPPGAASDHDEGER
ncbi:MAG: pyrroline-5-carboxylate reductase [Acidobacteria bacterium]|nr:pyrroline-5-carboxylate reductase [Acidobacteriota bacterium]